MTDTLNERPTRSNWADFDGVNAPSWLSEEQANLFCSLLNSYIPREYSMCGTCYHIVAGCSLTY